MAFENLSTVSFQKQMKPAAVRIYKKVFPGCEVQDLKGDGVKVHVLDQEFGIDALIHLKSQQWISIQEKYREHKWIDNLDFTQEYKNAVGTPNEAPGEWFKLAAQLYFYGWANESMTDFEKWVILDVAKYKLFVDKAGGLDAVGTLMKNSKHGAASFYTIPIKKLQGCFYTYHKKYEIVHSKMARALS